MTDQPAAEPLPSGIAGVAVQLAPAALAELEPGDVRGRAWLTLTTIAAGVVLDPRAADVAIKAARAVLDITSLEWMTDAQIRVHSEAVIAEIERRRGLHQLARAAR